MDRTWIRKAEDDRVPLFLPMLLAITLVYLLVEVSFASFLVDLLGSKASPDAIDRAEHAGRMISGVALALAYWGIQIPRQAARRVPAFRAVAACILSASLCIGGVYYGERLLIDGIVAASPAPMRQQAARSIAVRDEFFVASPAIIGIDAPSIQSSDDAWNAFRGLFPFISLYDEDVLDRTAAGRNAVVAGGIDANLPDTSAFAATVLPALFDAMEARYAAYVEASNARDEAVAAATARIRKGWEDNVAAMRRLDVIGPNATRRAIERGVPRIRAGVQRNGVPVPDHWNPTDQETFQRAAWGEVMPDINGRYNDAVARILGHAVAVPPNLSDYDAFLREPGVQQAMRLDLGIPRSDAVVLPGLDAERLSRLRDDYAAGLSKRLESAYSMNSSAFGRGGEFADLGESAIRAMAVPPLALSLSLLGAIVHAVKLLNFVMAIWSYGRSRFGIRRFLRLHPRLRFGMAMAGSIAMIVGTYTPASAIVDSPYYQEASAKMSSRMGLPADVGIGWTISMQRILAPAGDLARSTGVFMPIEAYLAVPDDPPLVVADVPVVERPVLEVAVAEVFPRPRPAHLR